MGDIRRLEDQLNALEARNDELKGDRERLASGRAQWADEDQVLARLLAAHNARKAVLDQAEVELDQEDGEIKFELTQLKTELDDVRAERDRTRADEDDELSTFEENLGDLDAEANPRVRKDKHRKK